MVLKVVQANLQHSKLATANLARKFRSEAIDVALIQEPWVVKGRVAGLAESGGKLLYENTVNTPRSCLLINKDISVLLQQEFCTRDTVTAKLKLGIPGGSRDVIICSAYFPHDSAGPPPTEEVEALIDAVERRGENLIIGADVNAHHVAWGSTNCNTRGEHLLEFIAATRLVILNEGNSPTFITRVRREVLDATFCTPYLANFIKGWRVDGEPSLADHQHIRFEIEGSEVLSREYRDPRKTDWTSFRRDLGEAVHEITHIPQNVVEMNEAAKSVEEAIMASYHRSCPVQIKTTARNVRWWSDDLARRRREIRRLFKVSLISNAWDHYHRKLTEYNREVRKAKRRSWKKFCEGVESCSETARLHKLMGGAHVNPVATLIQPNGTYTRSGRDTLRCLLECHFPACEVVEGEGAHNAGRIPSEEDWRSAERIITQENVRWSISTFEAVKSPGPDGIVPILLQEGEACLVPVLTGLFRASLALGVIPQRWALCRVVFIPKPGRDDYAQAKAYRPICLTSFLLKAQEKILDKYIRGKVQLNSCMHERQYAFRSGRSTESALHQLVGRIEESLEDKDILLGAFLDIEGAFSNTVHGSMVRAIERCGVDNSVSHWVKSLLGDRRVQATMFEETITVRTTRGCAQGGVLSPLLWNLVVDGLICQLNEHGYYTQGYADDLVIAIRGADCYTVSDLMQHAFRIVQRWCLAEQLTVNPAKTSIVAFTRKRNLGRLRAPSLFRERVPFRDEVKYLGVILDKKLTWNSQMDRVTSRAKKNLQTCKRVVGSTWGVRPKMVMWIYSMVVKPMVSYASVVWWPKVTQATARQKLDSLQRMACLSVTGAMASAPTAALNAILDLPPLWAYIMGQARMSSYRLQQAGCWRGIRPNLGHVRITSVIDGEALCMPSDHMTPKYSFKKPFATSIPSREDWAEGRLESAEQTIVWWTDGSKMEAGTGSGIYGGTPERSSYLALGRSATVFQAEVEAISACVIENLKMQYQGKCIKIYTDSQAAVQSLAGFRFTSKGVWHCLTLLIRLSRDNDVTVAWVPGHVGVVGNEEADKLARQGAETQLVGPEPTCGISYGQARRVVGSWLNEKKVTAWTSSDVNRFAKRMILGPSKELTGNIMSLNREMIRWVVGLMTGHCHLRKHLQRIGLVGDSRCRKCSTSEETAEHVLLECEALGRTRRSIMGLPGREMDTLQQDPVGVIAEFIRRSDLLNWG